MKELNNYIRKNILSLTPYSSARDEYSGVDGVFLDANENPFGNLNRYPDPYQKILKGKISDLKSVDINNIFVGNGSDEIIDLCFRVFCEPGLDNVIICHPTYGMYEVLANINNIKILKVALKYGFELDLDAILNMAKKSNGKGKTKMIIVCSPNNPSGNYMENVETLVENFDGIVLVDEAYIDFTDKPSLKSKIKEHNNLIVSQTFSKAWGLAAARVGMAFADEKIISFLNKVKPPYNVSEINQNAAIEAIDNVENFENNKRIILEQKDFLINELLMIPLVEKIYPSDANFILVKVNDAATVFNKLKENNVVVRNRDSVVNNCIRITVGSPEENKELIRVLKSF